MSKHTKGPWDFYTSPQPNGCPIVGSRGLMVAMLAHSVNEKDQAVEALANANLISAAPDLLEALNQIIWKLERKEVTGSKFDGGVRCEFAKIDRNDAVIEMARAVIQKATGEQS